ncbi:MAG: MFS transporter [Sphingobacteriaceae bacterium]|nr:MFS transporter [Sphingobacteriaceae bacterium]
MQKSLVFIVSVFFFWGFVAASNDILIPVFKEHLQLEQWQSQMIAFAFYVAYTLGSLGYLLLNSIRKRDLIAEIGFGKALSIGLWVSALGTLLFIPAANNGSFALLLAGLIVVGIGFSLQQTVANPLTIRLGTPETGSQRLSLAGGINNLGTTLGPLLLSFAIFGGAGGDAAPEMDIAAVKIPYVILGAFFVLFGLIFWRKDMGRPEPEAVAGSETAEVSANGGSLFSQPQVWMGMLAIFLYVGVEVSTASNLPEYLKIYHDVPLSQMAPYISLFWASLMIGRWTAASGALGLTGNSRQLARWGLPLVAFGIFLGVNSLSGYEVSSFLPYLGIIGLLILADWAVKGNPAKQLLLYSGLGAVATLLGMYAGGIFSVFAFLAVGLFCSTLWPCIFTLAIAGMGARTSQVSNALIMMIMGGGFVSVLQGWLGSEEMLGIRDSYWIGVACFAYLAFYAFRMMGILKQKGIALEQAAGGVH